MILDADISFTTIADNDHTAQAIGATAISNNVIDTTRIPRTIISDWYFVVDVEVVFAHGSASLLIDLVTSAAEALTTPTVEWSSGTQAWAAVDAWTANSNIYAVPIPPRMNLRYLGVKFTASATFTGGSLRAYITPNAPFRLPAAP